MTIAKKLWIIGLAIVAGTIIAIGLIDFGLFLFVGEPYTISAWLRLNMIWYVVPASLMLLFVVGLGVHLFFFGPWKWPWKKPPSSAP